MGRPRSPERRENQLISMAYDLAEQQIRNGTASAQVISHFLKLGSTKDRLEREILVEQRKLVSAKAESYESMKTQEELYANALSAMRRYNGMEDPMTDEE